MVEDNNMVRLLELLLGGTTGIPAGLGREGGDVDDSAGGGQNDSAGEGEGEDGEGDGADKGDGDRDGDSGGGATSGGGNGNRAGIFICSNFRCVTSPDRAIFL